MRFHSYMESLGSRRLLASIGGIVWSDANSSLALDQNEKLTPGVTVFIDTNRNKRFDPGELQTRTDSFGSYRFTDLPAGNYDIMQVPPAGFAPTNPGRTGTLEHQFDIGLNYRSTLTPSQARAFELAAQRWESIIVGDLPDVNTDIGMVDDVAIDVFVIDIDGSSGTLAQAEPTRHRAGTQLPSRGVIEFDVADIASLEAEGKLIDTITHEMAHVLGFGTLWEAKKLLSGVGTNNPRFLGAQAKAAYNAITQSSSNGVPVESGGGGGTDLSHWREETMVVEQMTGYTEAGGVVEPISRVTIAQFADLGYTVNYNAADTWKPAGGSTYWSPADAGIAPYTRRVAVTSNTTQSDVDFAVRANVAPVVSSLAITPNLPIKGDVLTLSARATDADGDAIVGMTFYRESNGVAGLQAGGDTYVATKSVPKKGLFSATTASSGLEGEVTYYAVAVDTLQAAGKRTASVFVTRNNITPTRPTPLVVTRINSTTLRMQWKDRSDNEAGFRIEIATISSFLPARVVRQFNVPAGTVQSIVANLPTAKGYYFRIRSFNGAGSSAYTTIGPIA